ncbi:hypothetical protein APHAL10511_006929 [Amanita phalloides]|nr:hypothetical protein APHAL10511_006929 [Amanita phalloides]
MANASFFEFSLMGERRRDLTDAISESSSSNYRSSILSSVKFPSLRKLDISEGPPHHGKSPLLILKLTSSSFLNAVVEDEARQNLFTIRTDGNTTTVMRSDPCEGMTKTADVRWPENPIMLKGKGKLDGIQVQMRGNRWTDGEAFLRTGSGSSAPRKFTIPNYSHNLKWRLIGCSYWCTTPSTKGPVAILDPAVASVPAQLQIFETLHDRHDSRPMLGHRGVSIILLDYIIVTSMLLLTEPQEWMFTKRHEETGLTDVDAPRSNFLSGAAMTSTSQWRKIMYGEPIYPKRQTQSASSSGPSSPISDAVPSTPASPSTTLARVIHGVSLYPKFDLSPETNRIGEALGPSTELSGSVSPTVESDFTATGSASPSRAYMDPPFYHGGTDQILPPEHPRAPVQSITAPTSPAVEPSFDGYPSPSNSIAQTYRARSTPPEAQGEDLSTPPPLPGPSSTRATRSPSLPPAQMERRPSTARPLPRPPDAGDVSREIRHTRSQQGLQNVREKRSSYGQRALPSPPLLPPLSHLNAHRLGPVVDAGPVVVSPHLYPQPVLHSPTSTSPDLYSPARPGSASHGYDHHPKPPDQDDLERWMERIGASRRLPDDDAISTVPYDVPPPAYSSIDFGQ